VRGARLSVSEDTGLLRVGDASKRVRYVPAKTTTVVKRIKPPTDSDDEQARNIIITRGRNHRCKVGGRGVGCWERCAFPPGSGRQLLILSASLYVSKRGAY